MWQSRHLCSERTEYLDWMINKCHDNFTYLKGYAMLSPRVGHSFPNTTGSVSDSLNWRKPKGRRETSHPEQSSWLQAIKNKLRRCRLTVKAPFNAKITSRRTGFINPTLQTKRDRPHFLSSAEIIVLKLTFVLDVYKSSATLSFTVS